MTEILRYLADHCAFLFRPGWFRFVDSRVDESFGGDAGVVLESRTLRLVFVRDRGQLLLEFQLINGASGEWFSPGLLRGVLLGDRGGSEVLDAQWALFLAESLDELEKRLGDPGTAQTTVDSLREQAELRAQELFA
jgi:hypothetical protein